MPLEELRLLAEVRFEVTAREAGHDLEQDSDIILGLARRAGALDPEPLQIFAHPRQRPLVQKTGQIIGGIGQQLAATEANEKSEEFLADSAIVRGSGSGCEFEMRHAELGRIALQRGNA